MLWLSAACYFDYRRDRIPNVLIGVGMLTGIMYQGYLFCIGGFPGGGEEFLRAEATIGAVLLQFGMAVGLLLFRAVIIFAIFYPFFKLGMLGAGDVKLFCLLAFYLQGQDCAACVAGSFAIAALAGFGKLLVQDNLWERLLYFCSYMADVAKCKAFRLYFENAGVQERSRASVHMAGTVLVSVLMHAVGVY